MLAEDISADEISIGPKEKAKKDNKELISLGENAINQLELKVDMSNQEDVEQLSQILVQFLSYPNSELAEIHSDAMRLGNYDLEKPVSNRNETSTDLIEDAQRKKICPCCGFIKQVSTINVSTSFDEIKNMGVSTYLYFANYKKLAILLFILTIIYSIFALITNYIASKNGQLSNSKTNVDYISISLSSKQTNDNADNRRYYFIQCWLGIGTIVAWIFALAGIKYNQIKGVQEYDDDTISCSDYSVVMDGMPLAVTKDELQKQLDAFYQGLNPDSIPLKWRKPFKIAKLNIGKPFYLNQQVFKDEEIQNLTKDLAETKQKLVNLIVERRSSQTFSLSKQERKNLYDNWKTLNKKKVEKIQQISNGIKQALKQQPEDQITTVFVTFECNQAKNYITILHEPSLFGRLKSLCGKNLERFSYQKDGKQYKLDIRRAPEPQDIIWTNLGHKDCNSYLRKMFTFTATLILLGVCFGIVFGLSRAQQDAGGSRPISIAISMTISIVNLMLGQIIRRLTVFEKDYTETYRQASLAIKSIIAQMINTILIPIITAYYVKDRNFYYESGLVDNIFMLSISTIIVPPIMLFINPYRLAMLLYKCIMTFPKNKLSQNQKQFNLLHEGIQFQVGYQSIYPVSVFMFVCFYVSLQPIISVIAMIGYLAMYWIEKYSLLNRYRRPVPGMDFVNNAMFKMISLGPLVYSFGSLTWSNFSPNGIPPEALIPNLIALGLSVVFFAVPFNSIINLACLGQNIQKSTNFQDDRIFMPSQYDRLNPSTQAEGFEDYKKYMERKKESIKKLNKQQQEEFAKKMMLNAQRGQMMNQGRAHNAQVFNPFQSSFNYAQPQPMAYGYGYAAYAPAMPYVGYSAYNPMSSFAYGGYGLPQVPVLPAPMPVAMPAVVHMPPQASHLQQSQVNMGRNNNMPPQTNPISSFISNVQPVQQGYNVQPGYVHNPNMNQVFPQVPTVVNNSPAFSPFNIPNTGANVFYGNYQQGQQGQQGRRW